MFTRNTKMALTLALAWTVALASCDRNPTPPAAAPAPVAPAPVAVQPAPVYVEEGAVVNGVVVAPPTVVDGYVLIGGEYYYWHPELRCWVHARRALGWHPDGGVRVYHSWGEHPRYRR